MWTAGYYPGRPAWHLVQIIMNILSSGKTSGCQAAPAAGKVSSELRCSLGFSSLPACPHAIPLVLCLIM